ncbi:MAG: hypothetical protein BWY83_01477 [bacterium ADurb.Bin478]|nr:MAG: hypothetical protein BWY83_01477 [bacterium ADurb.Bin478]
MTKKLMTILRMPNAPDQATPRAKTVINQPPATGDTGSNALMKTPAAVANEPMAMVALMNWAIRVIHTAQLRGPGIRLNRSISPSPVQTV